MKLKKLLSSAVAVCAAAAASLLVLPAWGQADYPSRAIKLIVPFPAGGTSDVMGRMIAEELTKALKQPVIVENLGG
ncbi:MAG: tripartite tricarboxylate transporter substrate binding protein, partial [Polaromonas sp.]